MRSRLIDSGFFALAPPAPATTVLPAVAILGELTGIHEWPAEFDSQGRPKAGAGQGIRYFLRDHPAGFIYISALSGLEQSGINQRSLIQLEAMHLTLGGVEALHLQAFQVLHSTPHRPTPYQQFIPPRSEPLEPGIRLVCFFTNTTYGWI